MQVDKVALDSINDTAEVHLQSLDPWIQVSSVWFSSSLMQYILECWCIF